MKSSVLHYENGKDYDLIDVINDYKLNFNRGNIVKYVCRANRKGAEIQDLEKAMDYLKREIDFVRAERDAKNQQELETGISYNYFTK